MKRRFLVAALLVSAFLVALMLKLLSGKETRILESTPIPSERDVHSVAASNGNAGQMVVAHNTNAPPTFASQQAAAISNRTETIRLGAQAYNVDINYWGQILDQENQPLPGVTVRFRCMRAVYLGGTDVRDESVKESVVSDNTGSFARVGAKGGMLTVESLELTGYEARGTPISYKYFGSDGFVSDVSKPIIFKMWKKRGGETLIVGEKFLGIVPDGRIYTIDLVSGQKTEGNAPIGDLKVKIVRPPKVGPRDKFDWSAEIEGFDGGLIEVIDDDFMYLAPEVGYAPLFSVTMTASDRAWKREVEKRFFLTSRSGKCFGQMTVKFIPDYNDKSVFSVKYSLNPASSRNLEYDWTKQIRPGDLK